MGDTLTQEEIDALLNKMASESDDNTDTEEEPQEQPLEQQALPFIPEYVVRQGESRPLYSRPRIPVPEKKWKEHDFKNPKIFSKEQLRTLFIVHDNYAKHLSAFLSGILRTECTLSVKPPLEEQKYYEYNNALPESIMMGIIEAKPIEGNILIEISKTTAYTILDRLLGGTGDNIIVPKDFSDIEIRILEKFYTQITEFLKDAWASIVNITPKFQRVETNARLTQLMPIDETVIIVILSVQIRDQIGNISICIPCINLENILSNVSGYALYTGRRNDIDREANKEALFDHVKNSKLDIRGILGTTTLKLQELLYLQVGDVIILDTGIQSPITVKVGPHDSFHGEIGTKKNKIAIKIKEIL